MTLEEKLAGVEARAAFQEEIVATRVLDGEAISQSAALAHASAAKSLREWAARLRAPRSQSLIVQPVPSAAPGTSPEQAVLAATLAALKAAPEVPAPAAHIVIPPLSTLRALQPMVTPVSRRGETIEDIVARIAAA